MTSCVELHKVRYGNDPRSSNVRENDDMKKTAAQRVAVAFLRLARIAPPYIAVTKIQFYFSKQ